MASKPTYDLCIKTGSYTAKNGETKHRWKRFARIMKTEEGGKFGFLDLTFNPAGVPHDPDQSEGIFSIFPVDDAANDRPTQKKVAPAEPEFSDDIPF